MGSSLLFIFTTFFKTMNTRLYTVFLLLFPLFLANQAKAQEEKSLLWEISGNGLEQPSYLYGTMHVGDKRAHNFSDATHKAFGQSKAFAGELNMEEVDQLAILNLMKLPEGESLKDIYTDEEWTKIETYFHDRLHGDVNDFASYNTFFVYSLILQSTMKNQKGQAVDMYFFQEAKKDGKKLLGLEKVEEQMNAINSMPTEEQKKMLLETVESKKGSSEKGMKKMLKYYAKGDLEKLQEISMNEEMSTEFEANFITIRNHNMADRMVPIMNDQSTFVAVGALHLPGEEGVIKLLRKKGFTVKALH